MHIDKLIIERFLANRCDAEEAEQVHRYLTDHPETLQQYLQQEWDGISATGKLDKAHAAAMFRQVQKHTGTGKVISMKHLSWAAAAVLIIACCTWLYQPTTRTTATRIVTATNTTDKKTAEPVYNWQQQHNTSGNVQKITLQDGSVVSLSPAAVVKYKQPFEPGKRDIYLEGEAFFEVVKDKTSPFTVYSGHLSTTALGTSFRVTTTPAMVHVKLITGKVVIRSTRQLPGWDKDVYLMPGQQMHYNTIASIIKVSNTESNKQSSVPASAETHSRQEIVFDNTPMQAVLDKLMQRYKVPITYTREELNGISFSGTVFYNDSLPVILQVIGRMNDLSVTHTGDGFYIKKAIKE